MTETSSRIRKEQTFKPITLGNFAFNAPGAVTQVSLVDENGNLTTENVPKKYIGNKIRTQQYLEQRMKGIIKKGEDVNLEEITYTRMEHLQYTDKRVRAAVKTLIKGRDVYLKNKKPEELVDSCLAAKKQLLDINPPTKESLDCLWVVAMHLERVYEKFLEDYEKGAQVFVEIGLLIIGTYEKSGIFLLTEACKVMVDHKKFRESHKYFSKAVARTLKLEKYAKATELLLEEIKQYNIEKKGHDAAGDARGAQQCVVQTWSRICGICVIKIISQGVDIANMYFEKEKTQVTDIKYTIPSKNICEDIINAFRDNDNKQLERVKKSGDVGRYLPGYMNDLINGLNLKQSRTRSLNKKHSTDQL